MKVKELIESLQAVPEDLEVFVEEPYNPDIDMYGQHSRIKGIVVNSEGDFEWVDIILKIN